MPRDYVKDPAQIYRQSFATIEARLATFSVQPKVLAMEGAGHFFHGRLLEVDEAITSFFGPELGAAH